MSVLPERVAQQVQAALEPLDAPVTITLYDRGEPSELDDFLGELADLHPQLQFARSTPEAAADIGFGPEDLPAITLSGAEGPTRARFLGVPVGHEFGVFVQDILDVAKGEVALSPTTREFLDGLKEPVHLQVFTTSTCPYCPRAVHLAHQMALYSPLVTAEMVDANQFQSLSQRHSVYGVPKTVINDGAGYVEGAVPEGNLVSAIGTALLH